MSRPLKIGTRGSRLALAQARAVAASLGGESAGVSLEIMQTRGDRLREMRFSEQLDKGFFTTELEQALADGRVDLVVHSLKDLPTESPEGLMVAATPLRAPTPDVLLVRPDVFLDDHAGSGLPIRDGARIGTSAARRRALLAHLSPQLSGVDLRGNVPTRIEKCLRGDVDALVLARAGLVRLSLDVGSLLVLDLDPAIWIPAPGQGALAIQCRSDDADLRARLKHLDHGPSSRSVRLERTVLATLEGGCHAACGAALLPTEQGLELHMGMVIDSAKGWQTLSLSMAQDADGGEMDDECRRVVEAVQSMPSQPSANAPSRSWWSLAKPWGAS